MEQKQELLRQIPGIDEMLQDGRLVFFMEKMPRSLVVDTLRGETQELRREILSGRYTLPSGQRISDRIIQATAQKLKRQQNSLTRVVNATGVVLHTNLGRASLSQKALESIQATAGNYSNLEYDIQKGARGSRNVHVEKLICRVTGAEAAIAVNNNAAASMLCLAALARGKEVPVSRGELVEIGGSFRIPEIMEESGVILREVGTTNKTRISDYRKACQPGVTGALLKVHTSNYRIIGFTQETALTELAALGREQGLPVIYDQGSGLMVSLKDYGICEPTVPEAIAQGADVVLFSGDKLLGGPQGGIIAGKRKLIDRIKAHPLFRVFRADKMTLAALEATFFQYLDLEGSKQNIPVLHMLTISPEHLKKKAEDLKHLLEQSTDGFCFEVEPCQDQVGGGCAPGVTLPGWAVSVKDAVISEERLERCLRRADCAFEEPQIPIITHVSHDKVYLSVRTIREEEYAWIARAFSNVRKYAEKR